MKSRLYLVLSLGALSIGCSEELGPEWSPTTRVEGLLHVSGRPITSGWIEFIPTDGALGKLRSVPIRRDGTYAADRVPVGRVAVALTNLPRRPIRTDLGEVDSRLFRSWTTPTRRTIRAEIATRIDLDLAVEGRDYLRSRGVSNRPPAEWGDLRADRRD